MPKALKRTFQIAGLLVGLFLIAGSIAYMTGWKAMGTRATGERLERMQQSPQWREDRFADVLPRHAPEFWPTLKRWFFGGSKHRTPTEPLPVMQRVKSDFSTPPDSGLRITWLGHSTLIIEIDGHRVLIDPVWGERAAPFTWAGPKRFYKPLIGLDELPELDAILISHDHYDHLDYPTILQLVDSNIPFFVPLGVGAHLQYWGVPPERIIEMDWWDEFELGSLRLVATPARHFSGRSMLMMDRDQTLWAGWVLIGPDHRVYYSGDTAMFPEFKDIGDRLGPFHVTLIESGAYNQMWSDVHVGPEQAIQAHLMVQGELFIPVHWGLFDLALHSWTEPVERVLAAAIKANVHVAVPRPGESIEPHNPPAMLRWWSDVPWETAADEPVISTALPDPLVRQIEALCP